MAKPHPLAKMHPTASHAEGKIAYELRKRAGDEHVNVVINNKKGVCPYCNSAVEDILPKSKKMTVWYPDASGELKPHRTFIGRGKL